MRLWGTHTLTFVHCGCRKGKRERERGGGGGGGGWEGNNAVCIQAYPIRAHTGYMFTYMQHSLHVLQTANLGMVPSLMAPNFCAILEHIQEPLLTMAGWGVLRWGAGHTIAGTGVLFV